MQSETKLGRFGHHPDPAIDFCEEVNVIEGLDYDLDHGMGDIGEMSWRISRCLDFVAGVDENAIDAKKKVLAIFDRRYPRVADSRTQEEP